MSPFSEALRLIEYADAFQQRLRRSPTWHAPPDGLDGSLIFPIIATISPPKAVLQALPPSFDLTQSDSRINFPIYDQGQIGQETRSP